MQRWSRRCTAASASLARPGDGTEGGAEAEEERERLERLDALAESMANMLLHDDDCGQQTRRQDTNTATIKRITT